MATSSAVSLFWIWLAAAFGFGLLWVLWIYVGPRVLRRASRLLNRIHCSHADEFGESFMYRERRQLGDVQDVMHWVCAFCGKAEPVIERTDAEHRLAQVYGAVRTPHAQPKVEASARLRTVSGGKR